MTMVYSEFSPTLQRSKHFVCCCSYAVRICLAMLNGSAEVVYPLYTLPFLLLLSSSSSSSLYPPPSSLFPPLFHPPLPLLSTSLGARSAASIILRGANDFMVDEMERSLHDALCVVKRVLESNLVVPGGGAVETALSIYLENFATSIVSMLPHTCISNYSVDSS